MRLARALSSTGFDVSFVYFSSGKPDHTCAQSVPLMNDSPSEDKRTPPPLRGFLGIDGGINTFVIEDGVPPEHRAWPFFATPAMKTNLLNLITQLKEQGSPPTCLVSDSFVPWTAHVAQSAGIPRIEFWAANALSYLLNLNVPRLRRNKVFPERVTRGKTGQAAMAPPIWRSENPLMLDCIPCLAPISSELFPVEIRFDQEPNPLLQLFNELCSSVELGDRILVYSLSELDRDAFRGLQAMGFSTYAVAGPLLHYSFESHKGEEHNSSSASEQANLDTRCNQGEGQSLDCLSWLDSQAECSVIYIAFGTTARISPQDIKELAMGLQACGNPYLFATEEDLLGIAELQQEGFVQGRICGKGMVTSWAPQLKVLAHKAIGGFLTHCGWNSIVESLWEGVPMLCCPSLGDQMSNMWCVCNVWGNGLELKRTDSGGLERSYVEAGVEALFRGDEGLRARRRAKEVQDIVKKACEEGSESFINLQKLYEDMKALTCAKIPL